LERSLKEVGALKTRVLHGQTAQPREFSSKSVDFSSDDLDVISELLRIAQASLLVEAAGLLERHPSAVSFAEQLRMWAEQSADLRERIESR
jgi:hypothetical protein